MRFSALTLGLCLLVQSTSAALSKPALWNNLESFRPTFQKLPMIKHKAPSRWTSGRMPKGCRDEIIRLGRKPTDFEVWTVKTDDCADEWYFCQERGSPSINTIVDDFCRVPVRMRQWTKNIIHFKNYRDGDKPYYYVGFIGLFGDAFSTALFFHEISHAVDFLGGFHTERKNLHDEKVWLDAYNADSAIPDKSCNQNHWENLAQFPGLIVYDRFTNGALQKEAGISKIGRQLQAMADQGDWDSKYGGRVFDLANANHKCTHRFPPETPVDRETGEPRPNGKRTARRDNAIIYMDTPNIAGAVPSNCTREI